MKTKRIPKSTAHVLSILLICLVAGCDKASSARKASETNEPKQNEPVVQEPIEKDTPESQQNAIKPENKPQLVSVVSDAENGTQFANDNGKPTQPVFMQSYVYDTKKNKAEAAEGGMVMTLEEVPIRMSMSLGSGFSGSAETIFGNTFLDLSKLWNGGGEFFYLGSLYTPDGKEQASIRIPKSVSKIYINNEYLLYADDTVSVSKDGPFATIRWKAESTFSGLNVVATRNGKTIINAPLNTATEVCIDVAHCTPLNDVVKWTVEGNPNAYGLVAFPVRGATRGSVVYEIDIEKLSQENSVREPEKQEAPHHTEGLIKRDNDVSLIGIVRLCVEDPKGSFLAIEMVRPERVKIGTVLAIRRKTGIPDQFKVIQVTDDFATAAPIPGPGFGPNPPNEGDEAILAP